MSRRVRSLLTAGASLLVAVATLCVVGDAVMFLFVMYVFGLHGDGTWVSWSALLLCMGGAIYLSFKTAFWTQTALDRIGAPSPASQERTHES